MEWWRAVLGTIFPAYCPGCGSPAEALCRACLARVRPAPASRPPPGVDWWAAPFAYDGPLRELIARAKYRQARTGFPWLAEAVAAVVAEALDARAGHLDAVTWPPTTAERRRRRGFDQAERLARLSARALGLPSRPLLVRGAGPAQTGRSREDRAGGPVLACRRAVAGARLLVVDDVATTGATLSAAARALRAGGAVSVAAATAARTPLRGAAAVNGAMLRSDLKRPG